VSAPAARLKLKIDGGAQTAGCSLIRCNAKNLTGLDMALQARSNVTFECATDAAWLSAARVVRCWVKSHNEQPRDVLPALSWGLTSDCRWPRKVGMTSSHHGSYVRARNVLQWCKGLRDREWSESQQSQSKFGSQSATRLREGGVAVIADQHAAVTRRLYTPPVTPGRQYRSRRSEPVYRTRSAVGLRLG